MVFHGGLTPFLVDDKSKKARFCAIYDKLLGKLRSLVFRKEKRRTFLLRQLIKRYRIAICYAEFGPVGVGSVEACRATNTRLIVNFHGYDAFKIDTIKEFGSGYKELFSYCEKVVCVSRSMKSKIIDLGCDPQKLIVRPCLPNAEFFTLARNPILNKLVFVGRFVEKKGPWLTILAFNEIIKTHKDAQLWMAGDGPLLGVCKSLVKSFDIPNVKFLGAIGHQDVKKLLTSADIYVQHSIIAENGDREGNPVAVMEAMAMGIPVVATRHEGISETIKHNVNGLLVEEHDFIDMSVQINRLMSCRELKADLGSMAREKIKEMASQSTIGFLS
ncbi:hypothetical protein C9974_07600 [Marinobacter sp. B9-2]|nr:hypothetical protein C9974_07600 [Marinobacter sp. B9-2]